MRGKFFLHEKGQEVQKAITDVREKRIYEKATTTADGLMSKEDKSKLEDMGDDEELTIEEISNLINF